MSPTNGHDRRAKPIREVGSELRFKRRANLMMAVGLAAVFFHGVAVCAGLYGDLVRHERERAAAAESTGEVSDAR